MTDSRRSGALGATADGDWKTTGDRPRLEERRGRRPVVGETDSRRDELEEMAVGWREDGGRNWDGERS
jgi:hypothetical protein